MDNYQNYRTWLSGVNSINPPQQTPEEKQAQLQSDARIKSYVTSVMDDTILSKILGLSLISNGIIPRDLAEIFFIKRMERK